VILIKTEEEIEKIRAASRIVAQVLEAVSRCIEPGISTWELNELAEKELTRFPGALPAFKGYRGYPASLCTSVNEAVVHGIPSRSVVLEEGDIISFDFGVLIGGYYGDSAVTRPVGKVAKKAKKLMKVTRQALFKGIEQMVPGNRKGDISHAIQAHVESYGYSVVREFVGHGIGKSLHEEPQVPNFGPPGQGERLKAGMVMAIEPMINMGSWEVECLADGWTAVTKDRSLSAHFEHTVAITEDGPDILTLP
jgi:methionyl aminopeptidase